MEACIAKPGLIGGEGAFRGAWMGAIKTVGRAVSSKMPVVDVDEIAAALLDRAVNAGCSDDFESASLVRTASPTLKALTAGILLYCNAHCRVLLTGTTIGS